MSARRTIPSVIPSFLRFRYANNYSTSDQPNATTNRDSRCDEYPDRDVYKDYHCEPIRHQPQPILLEKDFFKEERLHS